MLEVGIEEPEKLVQVAHAFSTRSRSDEGMQPEL